jgi:hypothetical protein
MCFEVASDFVLSSNFLHLWSFCLVCYFRSRIYIYRRFFSKFSVYSSVCELFVYIYIYIYICKYVCMFLSPLTRILGN